MKYLSFNDLQKRELFNKYELEKIRLKSIIDNCNLSFAIRFLYNQKVALLNRNTSYIRIKNRCLINGRSKSVYRRLKLNRISIRELMGKNLLNGYRKSSW